MPSSAEFDYAEFSALKKRVEDSDTVVRISINDGMRKLGRLFVPAKGTGPLTQATPRGQTGKLGRSTFFEITGAPERQVLRILQPARSLAGAFYGHWVREGAEPHDIRPVKAKALRWFSPAGVPIFAMLVHHPGNQPNPYHRRVLQSLSPRIRQTVREMGEKVTAYIAGR